MKKRKRSKDETSTALAALAAFVDSSPTPIPATDSPPAAPSKKAHDWSDRLQGVRVQAMRTQSNTYQVIADLEMWRAEIDATIAFLRAQRNKPLSEE